MVRHCKIDAELVKRLVGEGKNFIEIAGILGVSAPGVQKAAVRAGLARRYKVSEEDRLSAEPPIAQQKMRESQLRELGEREARAFAGVRFDDDPKAKADRGSGGKPHPHRGYSEYGCSLTWAAT